MPELPAVEFTRRLIEEHCIDSLIESVNFMGSNSEAADEIIFSKAASQFLSSNDSIRNLTLVQIGRLGKQLWLRFDDKSSNSSSHLMFMHLGMSGFVQIKGHERLKYASSPSNRTEESDTTKDLCEWPPRFCKLLINFKQPDEEAAEMAYCDARRFGRIDYLKIADDCDILKLIRDRFKLGFDPLIDKISFENFMQQFDKLKKRRINVKTLLMEQSFVAGIGNWMADDILLAAGIRPQKQISTIISDPKVAKQFYSAIHDVSKIAVEATCENREFPKNWLFHVRWDHGTKTLTGDLVQCEKIGGRSTFWVPKYQK